MAVFAYKGVGEGGEEAYGGAKGDKGNSEEFIGGFIGALAAVGEGRD